MYRPLCSSSFEAEHMEAPLNRGRWGGTAQQLADAIKSIVIPKGSDFLRYDAIDKVYQARTDVRAIRENHGLLQALYGLCPAFCFSKKQLFDRPSNFC